MKNRCNQCSFVAKTFTGLRTHMRRTPGHNWKPLKGTASTALVPAKRKYTKRHTPTAQIMQAFDTVETTNRPVATLINDANYNELVPNKSYRTGFADGYLLGMQVRPLGSEYESD